MSASQGQSRWCSWSSRVLHTHKVLSSILRWDTFVFSLFPWQGGHGSQSPSTCTGVQRVPAGHLSPSLAASANRAVWQRQWLGRVETKVMVLASPASSAHLRRRHRPCRHRVQVPGRRLPLQPLRELAATACATVARVAAISLQGHCIALGLEPTPAAADVVHHHS